MTAITKTRRRLNATYHHGDTDQLRPRRATSGIYCIQTAVFVPLVLKLTSNEAFQTNLTLGRSHLCFNQVQACVLREQNDKYLRVNSESVQR